MSISSPLQLAEARVALASLLHKCRAAVDGGRLAPAHQTLMQRRIAALELALDLIDRESPERAEAPDFPS